MFVLISKYGFADLLGTEHVALDPSRVAAQIVSGIGFVGAGLIFVRQDAVRGLTTAATIWLAPPSGPTLRLRYTDGLGVLRGVLEHATAAGFAVARVSVHRETVVRRRRRASPRSRSAWRVAPT